MTLTYDLLELAPSSAKVQTAPAISSYLGDDDERGCLFELAPDDHVEVTQGTDLTGGMLVRAPLRLPLECWLPRLRVLSVARISYAKRNQSPSVLGNHHIITTLALRRMQGLRRKG